MLVFVLQHRTAIDKFSADRDNNMRQYELDSEEWILVEELVRILEVRVFSSRSMECLVMFSFWAAPKTRNTILLSLDTQSCQCHSYHGHHQ